MHLLVLNWLDLENPAAGGAEIHLHRTFGRLAGRGFEVTLIASGWPGAPSRTTIDGIDVQRVGGRYSYPLVAPRHARRLAREHPFDVVVEDLNKAPVFAPFWAGVPTILLVHHLFGAAAFQGASLPVAGVAWLLERPLPLAYRRLPVVAVSRSTRDDLVQRGFSRKRIRVIENGVESGYYLPGPETQPLRAPHAPSTWDGSSGTSAWSSSSRRSRYSGARGWTRGSSSRAKAMRVPRWRRALSRSGSGTMRSSFSGL